MRPAIAPSALTWATRPCGTWARTITASKPHFACRPADAVAAAARSHSGARSCRGHCTTTDWHGPCVAWCRCRSRTLTCCLSGQRWRKPRCWARKPPHIHWNAVGVRGRQPSLPNATAGTHAAMDGTSGRVGLKPGGGVQGGAWPWVGSPQGPGERAVTMQRPTPHYCTLPPQGLPSGQRSLHSLRRPSGGLGGASHRNNNSV